MSNPIYSLIDLIIMNATDHQKSRFLMCSKNNKATHFLKGRVRPLVKQKTRNDPPCCVVAAKLSSFWRCLSQESALVKTGLNSSVASIGCWPALLADSVSLESCRVQFCIEREPIRPPQPTLESFAMWLT